MFDKDIFIPKKETQQVEFLAKYPEFDGRGLTMAIIDAGIDVSLPGLQKTSTGLRKIIDCFEFTGNGRVDTSAIKKLDENHSLIALSGRHLKIPLNWKNPSGEWHLGKKSLFNLCQQIHVNNYFEQKFNHILTKAKKAALKDQDSNTDNVNEIDCIVWNDGEKWLSTLITFLNCNELKSATVLKNFGDGYEYCFLIDKMTCCITITEEGNVLQIFASTCSHGTEVAQVASSYYPNDSESINGLAPGAQIYFMDMISGTSESGNWDDAFLKCSELGVSLINISLEYNFESRVVLEALKEMQNQHGTIIVKSAGNDGPLFRTTKTGEVDDQLLIVGSLITPAMHDYGHKTRSSDLSSTGLSSSCGPSISDDSRGISFVAPGEAIIKTTQWVSKEPQIVQGTSLAAPNAAGAIACLLSALKATSIPYSPALIKFALENTAIPLQNKLTSGSGIIQIDAAFEFLKSFSKIDPPISIPKIFVKNTNLKGIVVLDYLENEKYVISVDAAERSIPWILKLFPETSNKYISHSKIVENGLFDVAIMTNSLERGKLYYSEIHGYHPSHTVAGSFFYLPITVIIPEIITANFYKQSFTIQPNIPIYLFLRPPAAAKTCIFKLSTPYFCVLQKTVQINSEKANDIGVLQFTSSCCDISLRWIDEVFDVCFHKQTSFSLNETLNFEVRFIEHQ